MCGFDPGDTPGIGTYYDFINRLTDGPYRKRPDGEVSRSTFNAGLQRRSFGDEKKEKKENRDPHQSQSEALTERLLSEADSSRPDNFQKVLEDLLVVTGIIPSVEAGLITDLQNLTVSGDGSALETAASPCGQPTCDCRKQGIRGCEHPRDYTSPTAAWCYDAAHDKFVFGDRYYHLAVTQNGHDFPLLTLMPGGNESDYTLSLHAADRYVKAVREHNIGMSIGIFCGDGHHDSYAHYRYFAAKGIIPVIPLSEGSRTVHPHLPGNDGVRFGEDGTPLCPGGKPMRRHGFNKNRNVHVFTCPAKKPSRKDGKHVYVTHEDQCPCGCICEPESSIGPCVYVKSDDDPRLFPPIPRGSRKYKTVMNQRSASERLNAVNDSFHIDRSCRNADRGLVRLTLANIVTHAVIRYNEAEKSASENCRKAA
ncbi:MAG: hypothetical protein GY795_15695 [Desulfobacterales bacterium]|nr:hypothetical protein [Desulfobacterales bacterium]